MSIERRDDNIIYSSHYKIKSRTEERGSVVVMVVIRVFHWEDLE